MDCPPERMGECKATVGSSGFFFAWFMNLILGLLSPLNNFLRSSLSYFLFRGTPSRVQQALLAKLSGSRILLKSGACSPFKLEGSGPGGGESTQLPLHHIYSLNLKQQFFKVCVGAKSDI